MLLLSSQSSDVDIRPAARATPHTLALATSDNVRNIVVEVWTAYTVLI